MKIEVYSKDFCPYCLNAKAAMKEAGLEYTDVNIPKEASKEDVQKRVDALGLDVKIMTVPQIFIDDQYVGGYDELVRKYPWAAAFKAKQQARQAERQATKQ